MYKLFCNFNFFTKWLIINRRDVYKPLDKSDSLKLEIDKIQTDVENIKQLDSEKENTLSE